MAAAVVVEEKLEVKGNEVRRGRGRVCLLGAITCAVAAAHFLRTTRFAREKGRSRCGAVVAVSPASAAVALPAVARALPRPRQRPGHLKSGAGVRFLRNIYM